MERNIGALENIAGLGMDCGNRPGWRWLARPIGETSPETIKDPFFLPGVRRPLIVCAIEAGTDDNQPDDDR
jgi:hypothetical protein